MAENENPERRFDVKVMLLTPLEAARFFKVTREMITKWISKGIIVPYMTTPSGEPRFSQVQLESFLCPVNDATDLDGQGGDHSGEMRAPPADLITRAEAARILGLSTEALTCWQAEQTFMPDLSTPSGRGWYSGARIRSLNRTQVLAVVKREREKYFDSDEHTRRLRRKWRLRRRWIAIDQKMAAAKRQN